MEPKPAQWGAEFGAWFTDTAIAEAYSNRPPYPQDAIELLVSLIADRPRVVLDAGSGTGDLARRLSQRGFSRTHLGAGSARAFDEAVRATLEDLVDAGGLRRTRGRLEMAVEARVAWGVPRL